MPDIKTQKPAITRALEHLLLFFKYENLVLYCSTLQLIGSPMSSNSESGILTIKDVAEYLNVTERTIYRLAAAKKIPCFKVGGMWRFRQADIYDWIASQSEKKGMMIT